MKQKFGRRKLIPFPDIANNLFEEDKGIVQSSTAKSFDIEYTKEVAALVHEHFKQFALDEKNPYCYFPYGIGSLKLCIYHNTQNTGDINVNFYDFYQSRYDLKEYIQAQKIVTNKYGFYVPEIPFLSKACLGWKMFKDYNGYTAQDMADSIIDELEHLIADLKDIGTKLFVDYNSMKKLTKTQLEVLCQGIECRKEDYIALVEEGFDKERSSRLK